MQNNDIIKTDIAIIGAGPAGLTCAIYAARANLDVIFIEKGVPGGKMTSTYMIENWSGTEQIKGYELSQKMLNHAKKANAKYVYGEVKKINSISEFNHELILSNDKIIKSKIVVIATGMESRKPIWLDNYIEFENKGLSYCVICDASFYKNKPAAIIGGGDSAFEEAIYLSTIASEVNIFVKESFPKAEASIVSNVEKIENINVFYNSTITKLIGEKSLEQIEVLIDGNPKKIIINHLYPYIGFDPNNNFAKHLNIFEKDGFIITDENMETSQKGIYAIGDIRKKTIRQIVTAASDGAIAGKNLTNKLKSQNVI